MIESVQGVLLKQKHAKWELYLGFRVSCMLECGMPRTQNRQQEESAEVKVSIGQTLHGQLSIFCSAACSRTPGIA